MQAILQGSTAQFSPDQILRFLALNGHSGTLEITSAKEKALVSFESGKPVYAQTAGAARGTDAILEVFAWDPGVFTFYDGVYVPEQELRGAIDLESALQQGAKRAGDYRAFRASYPNDHVILRLSDDASPTEGVHLEPAELRMLLKIGPGRSIGQLSSDFRQPSFELFPMLKRLEGLGLITRADAVQAVPRVDPAGITLRPGDVSTDVRDVIPLASQSGTQRVASLAPPPAAVDAAGIALADVPPPQTEERSVPQALAPVPDSPPPPEPPLQQPPQPEPEAMVVAPPVPPPPPAESVLDMTAAAREPEPAEPPAEAPPPPDIPERVGSQSGEIAGVPGAPLLGTLTMTGGTMFPLVDEMYAIGRDPGNSIPISEQSVSSFHAKIIRGERGFFIEDTRSRNGTFVNGERVESPRLLADADVIRVGKVVMTFTLAKPAGKSSTTASPRA